MPAAAQATPPIYTVNSNNLVDDGVCDVAHCSLPEAIKAANGDATADIINFSGPMTITVPPPAEELPPIFTPVTLIGGTGTSEATCTTGTADVFLSGHTGADGLVLEDGADGSRICRMNVGNFDIGIDVQAGADNVTIGPNGIGTDGSLLPTGGNTTGINLAANATVDANTIANNSTGVRVQSGAGAARVLGNYIGTDGSGISALPNGQGVWVSSPTAVVGGPTPNLISGNSGSGIVADAGTIIGNRIGTDTSGTFPTPNATGVTLPAGSTARVGGTAPAEQNLISGNTNGPGVNLYSGGATVQGNRIGTNASGTAPLPNQDGIAVRNTAADALIGGNGTGQGNLISGNGRHGIAGLASTTVSGLKIEGNTIGLNLAGTSAVPNQDDGINLGADHSNVGIGGTVTGAGNRISGNGGDGIESHGTDVAIMQNTIGLTTEGLTAVPNGSAGVRLLYGSSNAVVGGSTAAHRNVITGNRDRGIVIGNGSQATTVQGNYLGLAADGASTVNWTNGSTPVSGNAREGVLIAEATNAKVGGTAPGEANVISANSGSGIAFTGGVSQSAVVEGNRIGTDATGQLARGNEQGGILLAGSANARIGGTTAAARNVISGNDGPGLDVQTGVAGAQVHGNLIGVAADGATPLGNTGPGVFIRQIGTAFTLGGTAAGTGNVIRHNAGDGVQVGPNASVRQNAILGNTIADNGAASATALGIDLVDDGVTANDPGDLDAGENDLQNFPVLTGASTDGAQTTVTGTIDTTPGRTMRIEAFSSTSCDPSGHGQGETFLGAAEVTAGAGATPFTATVAATDTSRVVTMTATDLTTNETSEFSACQPVVVAPPPPPIINGPSSPLLPEPPAAGAQATVTPKLPAKLKVRRAGIDDGVLDLLVEITSAAATSGAKLELDYESSGRHTKFSVPITTATKAAGGEALLKIRKKLPSTQPKDTGIIEIAYAGNSTVAPDEVRLRAADVQAKLVRSSSTLSGGRLKVSGTVSSKARGVVRLRLGYTETTGAAAFQSFNATIKNGRWSLDRQLTGTAAAGGYLSIQFTGYQTANMRGEQTGKQLP
jgi:hypothetical protein